MKKLILYLCLLSTILMAQTPILTFKGWQRDNFGIPGKLYVGDSVVVDLLSTDTVITNVVKSASGNLKLTGIVTGIVEVTDTLDVDDISNSAAIEIRASGDNDDLFTLTTTSNVPILSVSGGTNAADAIQVTADDGNVLVTAPDTLKIKTTAGTYRYVRAYTASNVPTIQAVGGTNNTSSLILTNDDGNLMIQPSDTLVVKATGDAGQYLQVYTASNLPTINGMGSGNNADAISLTAGDGNVMIVAPDTLKIKSTAGTYRYVRVYTSANVPTLQAVGGTNNANSLVVTADDGNLVATAPDTLKFVSTGATYRYVREYTASNIPTFQAVGGTNNTDALSFTTDDGNILISPADSLRIDKPIRVYDDMRIGLGSGKAGLYFDDQATDYGIFENCNLGIGTVNPTELLHVYNSSTSLGNTASVALDVSGGGGKSLISSITTDVTPGARQSAITFTPGGTVLVSEKMRIAYSGNVGIGTTAPSHPLTVGDVLGFAVKGRDEASTTDSSLTITIASGEPTITVNASDGDQWTVASNTSDQAVFAGAAGGYLFNDGDIGATASRVLKGWFTAAEISTAGGLTIGGAQINSDALSDVASVAMLDENEEVTGAWTINNAGGLQVGKAGQSGLFKLYSEQGGTDYTMSLYPNTAMTSAASFYLPADEPAGTYLMNMTTGGVMGFDATDYQEEDATIDALAGLTIADVSIIEGTGPDAVAMVASGGANYMLASDGTNANLIFITPATVLSNIGAQASDATLTDIADGTIAEDLVNTANPWADNEVADNITASSYVLLTAVDDSAAFQVTKSLTEAKTITGNWVNTTNPWADNEVADDISATSYTLLTAFDDSLNNAHTVTSKWIFSKQGTGALVVNDSAFVDTLTTTILNANTSITSGVNNTTAGNLSLLGGATTVGPKLTLYNSVDEDDTEDYWSMEPQGTNFWFGSVSDLDQFIFSNAGNFTASGNVAAATYGSDASISNAELLTLDNGATTEILVGGGAGVAPVWTTATGTGAPVRAGSPTVTGTLTVDNVTMPDPGTSANSYTLTMRADNAATVQEAQIQTMYGADPYLRFSAPNDAGTATAILDLKDQRIVIGAGTATVDYDILVNGESNDGTITYMEDENRFDFSNDVDVVGDLTAGTVTSDANVSGDYFTSNAGEDIDFDTDEVLITAYSAPLYGLLVIRESIIAEACVFLLCGNTLEKIGADATFTTTFDNASTYNVYYDGELRIQNKVGDNKSIKVAMYGM